MIIRTLSAAIQGIDAYIVEVEVDLFNGLPGITVVGLPDLAVQESRERVRSAIKNSDFTYPLKRMTINMAPAHTRKSGPVFELAMALGILAASDQLAPWPLQKLVVVGELSLDGSVRPVQGVLPFAIAAREAGYHAMLVPEANKGEAALVEGLAIYPVTSLSQAVYLLNDLEKAIPYRKVIAASLSQVPDYGLDYAEVKGQAYAKRGLEVAAAGGHNLIMVGPPGSGKTMLARRLPSILPPLSFEEALETSKIYSISGHLPAGEGLIQTRPFRAPHHSISNAGLVGGSSVPRPGEISLAHHGILFLDELLEFKRPVLEVLRQPLEDRRVTISRALVSITYPADFMLVASMNPCPCGFQGDRLRACVCTPQQVARYWAKLSGPLLDRVDIHLEVPRLKEQELMSQRTAEASGQIRQRVLAARERQNQRFAGQALFSNAQMGPREIGKYCPLDAPSRQLLHHAIQRLNLSARAYDRILKVARTIADLDGSADIGTPHVAEAIQFRSLDRQDRLVA